MPEESTSLVEFGVVMTIYLVIGTAVTLFVWRAIRLASAEGRADRKRLWRIALLKSLLALFVLSLAVLLPSSSFVFMFLPATPVTWLPWIAPGSAAFNLFVWITFVGFVVMIVTGHAALWLIDARLFRATYRSSPFLRALGTRYRLIRLWLQRQPTMIRLQNLAEKAKRYDRRIW